MHSTSFSKPKTSANCKDDTRAITLENLTRICQTKQFLLPDKRETDIIKVVGTLCGLQAQAALTPYLALWNRIKDFKPEMLDKALYDERSLVKTWCVRGTLHIIPSGDLPIYHNALERMWFEHHGRYMREPDWPSIEKRRKTVYPKILEVLREKPLRRKELSDRTFAKLHDHSKPFQRLFSAWGGILKETAYLGLTVCAEPCGREACFARTDQWLPSVNLDEVDEVEARRQLFLKYLQSYGPASLQDFAYWSGLLAGEAKKAAEDAQSELEEVHVKGSENSLWMSKSDFEQIRKTNKKEELALHLLPKFDPYLLGHRDKTRILKEEFRKRVYRQAGDIAACLIVNGRILGTWKYKKTKKKLSVAITPFQKLEKETIKKLQNTVNALGAFMNTEETKLILNQH